MGFWEVGVDEVRGRFIAGLVFCEGGVRGLFFCAYIKGRLREYGEYTVVCRFRGGFRGN